MKKKVIILMCILLSFVSGLCINTDVFLTDSKSLIGILLTLLGLCFSGFSFISSSITGIIKKNNNKEKLKIKSREIIKSIEEDIFLILYLIIILIICNLVLYLDIPFVKNPINVDFDLFIIVSMKKFIFNFLSSFSFCLSFYAFYDLIKATFNLLRSCYE